jgi:dolichol-phosphate mannosyltransferase
MKKLITYIFPIYNESGNIDLLYQTMQQLLQQKATDYDFELVFINDGSRDDSLQKLYALQQRDNRIAVINFARNFGHQLAVTAGLDYAHGDAVIIMDSDMQDPPSVSFELIEKWQQGFDVVYAQRRTRQDSLFKKMSASVFYWVLWKVAEITIPRNTGDFRLVDRKVVDTLKQFREHNRFLRGMVSYVGFRQAAVMFDRDKRHAGVTGYPLKKMLKFASDGILGFSWAPLKLIGRVGYMFSALSFLGIVYAIARKVLYPSQVVSGWTFTTIVILMIGGIQMIMIGVLGSYIGRIYSEVQGRPLYIIESVRGTTKSDKAKR